MLVRMSLAACFNGLMMGTFESFHICLLGQIFGVVSIVGRLGGLIATISSHGTELIGSKIAIIAGCLLAAVVNGIFLKDKK
jgi:hypothetical protein